MGNIAAELDTSPIRPRLKVDSVEWFINGKGEFFLSVQVERAGHEVDMVLGKCSFADENVEIEAQKDLTSQLSRVDSIDPNEEVQAMVALFFRVVRDAYELED